MRCAHAEADGVHVDGIDGAGVNCKGMNVDGARGVGARGANVDWGANAGDGVKGEVNGTSNPV